MEQQSRQVCERTRSKQQHSQIPPCAPSGWATCVHDPLRWTKSRRRDSFIVDKNTDNITVYLSYLCCSLLSVQKLQLVSKFLWKSSNIHICSSLLYFTHAIPSAHASTRVTRLMCVKNSTHYFCLWLSLYGILERRKWKEEQKQL